MTTIRTIDDLRDELAAARGGKGSAGEMTAREERPAKQNFKVGMVVEDVATGEQ